MTSTAKIPPKNNEKENVFIHSSDFAGLKKRRFPYNHLKSTKLLYSQKTVDIKLRLFLFLLFTTELDYIID